MRERSRSRNPRSSCSPPLVGGVTPRNHFYMKLNASLLADSIDVDIDMCGFKPSQTLSYPCISGLLHIPKRFRREMYKSFAEGFRKIVPAINDLLEAREFPTRERFLKQAMPDYMLPGSNAFNNQKARTVRVTVRGPPPSRPWRPTPSWSAPLPLPHALAYASLTLISII